MRQGILRHSARAILNSIVLCTQKRPALFKLCDNTPIIMSVFICNLDDDALRFYFPTGLERETGVLRQSYLSRPFLNTTQYHLYHQLFDLGMKTHTNARKLVWTPHTAMQSENYRVKDKYWIQVWEFLPWFLPLFWCCNPFLLYANFTKVCVKVHFPYFNFLHHLTAMQNLQYFICL